MLQLATGEREGVHLLLPYLGLENEPVLQRHRASPARSTGGLCLVMRRPAHAALTYFVPGRNGGEWQLVSTLEASGIAFFCVSF